MITVSPNEEEIFTTLRTFLMAVGPQVVPAGHEIDAIEGEANRVPEPKKKTFMVMWPINRPRLATNIDSYADTAFVGSIAATVLTVTEMLVGSIRVGATLFATGIAAGTAISAQISGTPGGVGTYTVSPSQALNSRKMACGDLRAMQETEVVMQVDVHSSDMFIAGNVAGAIATLWRDAYGVDVVSESNPNIAPLFCDDPRQLPFINGEQQYEVKWSIDLHMQVNQTFSGIPLQFFDATDLELINVDATYPAS